MSRSVHAPDLIRMKREGRGIVAVTAYDYASGVTVDRAGVDVVLVGDSLATVILGHPTTLPATMDVMVHHTRAVARGVQRALVVGDLPFLSCVTVEDAVRNGGRLMQEGGAGAVKLEGASELALAAVRALRAQGIPVLGHLGFTPQSVHVFGGHKVQAKDEEAARRLQQEASALQEAGVSAVVLELVPDRVAAQVTLNLDIPTIGIGAGPGCDGQIQVFHDLVGLFTDHVPRHAARYARVQEVIGDAVARYADDVRERRFLAQTEVKA
ncbi:MAG: 3-methyl-2-oxobutanoate hydroxymethyltransferase [Candidatus Sericytochromatia bacterium]|nr:3-methyl-2-oxobutanoate hydroxymethyltransferase [Candidatus Sericytochromatia bacterium]